MAANLPTQANVFCGYCFDADDLEGFDLCQGGGNAGQVCGHHFDCPAGTCGGATACTSDAGCTQPRERCRQAHGGAFAKAAGTTITVSVVPAGNLYERRVLWKPVPVRYGIIQHRGLVGSWD